LEKSDKTLLRIERLRLLNSRREWRNDQLYRLLYSEDLYIVAYERIKSAPGNLTPGSDGMTIDGFSLETIREIIQQMRTEQFQFKPARTVFIPKANGKMRKLGIPSTRDKVVQEVIRMILEAIYDSPYGPYFREESHGFRHGRSCHTALQEIRGKWAATNWIIEGDIQAFFDNVDHGILVRLLAKKITDTRFLNLIWKLLGAGYLDLHGARKDSLAGTPQGGLASPILANVYLHELDEKVEEIRQRLERGAKKRRNPLHRKLSARKQALQRRRETNTKEFRQVVSHLRSIPSVVVDDTDFIRVRYIRYADDWLIRVCGPRALAERIREELATFLEQDLHLTLSQDKTHITNVRTESAQFLGTLLHIGRGGIPRVVTTTNGSGRPIKRRSTGSEVVMEAPTDSIIRKLSNKGFYTPEGMPTTKKGWIYLDVDQIVHLYSGINRGLQNYYRFTDNFGHLARIQYILQFSLARTFAAKFKRSVKQIFQRFGRSITVTVTTKEKGDRAVAFYLNNDWKKRRNAFVTHEANVDLLRWAIRVRTRSKLGRPCCICGSPHQVEMHHVRHIRKMGDTKATGFKTILQALNRKQIPACRSCHRKIHRGEYDGMSLSDLAYNPYYSDRQGRLLESGVR
jgi:group II intron reverse transcriptase/maturase